jgi:hypothetical protein
VATLYDIALNQIKRGTPRDALVILIERDTDGHAKPYGSCTLGFLAQKQSLLTDKDKADLPFCAFDTYLISSDVLILVKRDWSVVKM